MPASKASPSRIAASTEIPPTNANEKVPISAEVPRRIRDIIDSKRGLATRATMTAHVLTEWAEGRLVAPTGR